MAAHGDFVRPYVSCRDRHDVQKSEAVKEAAECKRKRGRAEPCHKAQRPHVPFRVRDSGTELPFSVDRFASVGFLGSGCRFPALAFAFAEVLRENTYRSRTVEVQEDQTVIDTGLYGIVRHPMYSATIILFLSMPLVLGSLISFVIFLIYPTIISKRIRNEEKVLEDGLVGYVEYKKKVKYKVIPFLW